MLIREAIESRVAGGADRARDDVRVQLPLRLTTERMDVKSGMLKRLASSRDFSLGGRSGGLRAAQSRSGRAFRLDVRQRVIVKAPVSRHIGKRGDRAAAGQTRRLFGALGRRGGGGAAGDLRPRRGGGEAAGRDCRLGEDRHHFKFIISPEHGDRLELKAYVREVMARVSADLAQPGLRWIATCHYSRMPMCWCWCWCGGGEGTGGTLSSRATIWPTVFGRGRRRLRRSGWGSVACRGGATHLEGDGEERTLGTGGSDRSETLNNIRVGDCERTIADAD